ncbi:MAG: sulfatase-like hydrolase/transferase, partial [Gemmatimonadota bacterium]|nr:sulfatase-like hydrolase/transferase [Gemmatimonadota bacterium]
PEINYLFPMPNYTNLGFTPTRIRDLEEFLAEYRDSTFFAWYHFHGPHLPYSPPKAWIERFLPGGAAESKAVSAVMKDMIMPRGEYSFSKREQDLVSALYDGEVAAQDEQIGRVLEILDSLGLTGKTIVVLSSDHGEELFDHGWLGHASTSLNGTLFDESIRIPLIISLPDRLPRGRVVRQQVQSVDLMPTLFELMGLEWKGPCQGVSLMPVIGSGGGPAEKKMRPVVFCQSSACGYQCDAAQEPVWLRCVRTERYKLVQTTEPGREPAYSLYDLETDPGETGDIAGEKPAVLRQLLLMLHEHIFKNAMLRDSILAAGAVKNLRPGTAPEYRRCEILAPAEGAGLTFKSGNGAVHISWTGPGEGEYRIEYVVGRGKYHLDDSFTSIGNKKEFGPFNRIFWNALKLYNPWRFRVMPKHRPELASQWRSFTFE